jgi:hypothetical protein
VSVQAERMAKLVRRVARLHGVDLDDGSGEKTRVARRRRDVVGTTRVPHARPEVGYAPVLRDDRLQTGLSEKELVLLRAQLVLEPLREDGVRDVVAPRAAGELRRTAVAPELGER